MVRLGRTTDIPRREARVFLAKAQEFLAASRDAAEAGQHDASLLAAVHAAIVANDAVCVALLGRRSADPDHQRAVDLLESAADHEEGISTRGQQLRSLLAKKNFVAYEARRATGAEARDGLERASRFVAWGADVLSRARL